MGDCQVGNYMAEGDSGVEGEGLTIGLAAALEELHAATIVAIANDVIQKLGYKRIDIVVWVIGVLRGKEFNLMKKLEFHKLVGDLAAIDTAISYEDQAFLLLASLSSSYDNFVETLLYGRDTLKLEDVLATLSSTELQKITEATGDGGEELYVRKRSGQRDMEQGTYSAWSKSQGRSSRIRCYICQSEEHLKRDFPCADVMIAMSVEELLDWIMDSGSSYYITYMRDFLVNFKEYVLELRQNLISLGTLEKEGFIVKMQSGKIKVIKGSLVVLSGTRRANCVYTLNGQAVTRKTLKGRKQLGEYQTGWKIRTGNVLDFCNQRSTQQGTKSGVAKHLGVAVIHQHNGLVKEKNVTLLAKEYSSAIFIHLFLYIDDMVFLADARLRSKLPRVCWIKQREMYLVWRSSGIRVGSLSGDYDVEKNGKWLCIYAVGSQEYQVVCTRLDIASADVGMLDKFDHGLHTDIHVFVDFDYTMGRSITVMGRSITSGVYDTYGGCKGGYLDKWTLDRVLQHQGPNFSKRKLTDLSEGEGQVITGSWDRTLKCWDPKGASAQERALVGTYALYHLLATVYAFKCHRKSEAGRDIVYPVNAIAFHPVFMIYLQYPKYPTSFAALSFSKDGRLLAVASSYTYEEGEISHEPDAIFMHSVNEVEVKPKPRSYGYANRQ
ncbi:zinc finger, CCHC-type containing protein [Tanacetum coccineum]